MYKHVVVPLDGSSLAEGALGPATAFARSTGGQLLLYRAVEPDRQPASVDAYLAEVAGRLDGVVADTSSSAADPPAEGIERALRGLDDAILCMSSHGRGGIGRSLLGSVAEDVLGRVGDPLLLVGPHCEADRSPVEGPLVVCVDGSKLSEAIVRPAADWAKAFGMTVVFLQVISTNIEAELQAAGVRPEDVREGSYVTGLALRLKDLGVDPADWEVLRHRDPSQPASRIVEFVREREAGLVAMSTHGRTGLRRLLIGSVAMRVVHDASCPVLICRPAEFPAATRA
jgi:nucleotide-binding universal stress UspA family protein